jgi:hypothetical protein
MMVAVAIVCSDSGCYHTGARKVDNGESKGCKEKSQTNDDAFVQSAKVLIFIQIRLSVTVALVKHSSYVSQSQLGFLRHMGNRSVV